LLEEIQTLLEGKYHSNIQEDVINIRNEQVLAVIYNGSITIYWCDPNACFEVITLLKLRPFQYHLVLYEFNRVSSRYCELLKPISVKNLLGNLGYDTPDNCFIDDNIDTILDHNVCYGLRLEGRTFQGNTIITAFDYVPPDATAIIVKCLSPQYLFESHPNLTHIFSCINGVEYKRYADDYSMLNAFGYPTMMKSADHLADNSCTGIINHTTY